MNSLNYLKFDLRIIKESSKQYMLIGLFPLLIGVLASDSYNFLISYLFLFLVILASIPFNTQGNEKSNEMYYMFPAKVSSMVLGRFLYLISSAIIIFTIIGIYLLYLSQSKQLQNFEILVICTSGLICLIMCFIQYPLYYKFGIENSRIIYLIIYIVPAIFAFTAENVLKNNLIFYNISTVILAFCSLFILILFGGISYLISYRICKNKSIC